MKTSEYLLFSYGSNNPEQLEDRLSHEVEGIAAYLPDYRLVFVGYSRNWDGGVAGIIASPGDEVCGYVTEVDEQDLQILDRYEGAPDYYYRATVDVMIQSGDDFIDAQAVAYLPGPLRQDPNLPSGDYLGAVKRTVFSFWERSECSDLIKRAVLESRKYPRRNPDHPTTQQLLAWLQDAVPAAILQYLILARAVKVCSNVSPAFAIIARHYGFDAYQVAVPGHFYNVILTVEGPVKVDLSDIQFRVCGTRKDVKQAVKQLVKDPWSAVKIGPYEGPLDELEEPRIRPDMVGHTIESFQTALGDVKGLRARDPEILEEFEEIYPWFKTEDWEVDSKRSNPDKKIRDLERQAAGGDPEALERLQWMRSKLQVPIEEEEEEDPELCKSCKGYESDPEGLCEMCDCCSLCCTCGTFDACDSCDDQLIPLCETCHRCFQCCSQNVGSLFECEYPSF